MSHDSLDSSVGFALRLARRFARRFARGRVSIGSKIGVVISVALPLEVAIGIVPAVLARPLRPLRLLRPFRCDGIGGAVRGRAGSSARPRGALGFLVARSVPGLEPGISGDRAHGLGLPHAALGPAGRWLGLAGLAREESLDGLLVRLHAGRESSDGARGLEECGGRLILRSGDPSKDRDGALRDEGEGSAAGDDRRREELRVGHRSTLPRGESPRGASEDLARWVLVLDSPHVSAGEQADPANSSSGSANRRGRASEVSARRLVRIACFARHDADRDRDALLGWLLETPILPRASIGWLAALTSLLDSSLGPACPGIRNSRLARCPTRGRGSRRRSASWTRCASRFRKRVRARTSTWIACARWRSICERIWRVARGWIMRMGMDCARVGGGRWPTGSPASSGAGCGCASGAGWRRPS